MSEARPLASPSPRADLATALALAFASALPSLLTWLYVIALAGGRRRRPAPPGRLRGRQGGAVRLPSGSSSCCGSAAVPGRRWPRPEGRRARTRLRPGGRRRDVRAVLRLAAGFGPAGTHARPCCGRSSRISASIRGHVSWPWPRFTSRRNSLFEEYYYRWFVFGRMRAFMATAAAAVAERPRLHGSSRHCAGRLPARPVLDRRRPLSLCIAVGGGVWAWLYARTGSLYAPGSSHAIIDAAVLAIGWDLVQRG